MAAELFWHTQGQGPDLVLIHGWGMNSAVWQPVMPLLTSHFTVHCCDLPGYGESTLPSASSLTEIAKQVYQSAPVEQAAWLGWSLGGLIATDIALKAPERVSHLITVASSPCFAASENWKGIKPAVLQAFMAQLELDFQPTIERFMALQAMGSPSARQDIKQVKQAVLAKPQPQLAALQIGLQLLAEQDLRPQLGAICQPWLRLYGRLDGLVPVKTCTEMERLAPQSQVVVFEQASHAPFISHPEQFIDPLLAFCHP